MLRLAGKSDDRIGILQNVDVCLIVVRVELNVRRKNDRVVLCSVDSDLAVISYLDIVVFHVRDLRFVFVVLILTCTEAEYLK